VHTEIEEMKNQTTKEEKELKKSVNPCKTGKVKKVLSVMVVILVIATLLNGCKPTGSKDSIETLTLTGSTTVLPIAQNAAEAFMDIHPNARISVRGNGSGVGISALIDGTTDIANASRPIKTNEMEQAHEKKVNPVETVIAIDGIAIIVHSSNSIKGISLEQLKAIYTGEISDWQELGGKSGPIVVVSRDVSSGTFEIFKKLVLGGEKTREDALMLASNSAVTTAVANTPGAIGYIGLGYLTKDVTALEVNGVCPSKETITAGEYKLARSLYMYTNGAPEGIEKEFIDFILSPQGQKIVEEQGFVSIK